MDDVLCATTFGSATTGGGVFAIRDGSVDAVDHVSTLGVATDGRRVVRALHAAPEIAEAAEILISDERGVSHYLRLDEARGAHDVAWDGDTIVIVSPWHNAVQWYSLDGVRRNEIRLPGPADSWHVNCLVRHDGRWYATVFGQFASFRGWSPPANRARGLLIELETRRVVLDGLSSPHSPRFIDGVWCVCDSADQAVVLIDAKTQRTARRVACGGWTRGLAHNADFLFVGVSGDRVRQGRRRAEVVVVDRRSWEVTDRVALPSQEVYDVTLIPRELVDGMRIGFHANPTREGESHRRNLLRDAGVRDPSTLWPVVEPLSEADSRCSLAAQFPDTCTAGHLLDIPVTVTNLGSAFFSSAPPFAVSLSYRWRDKRGLEIVDGRAARTPLRRFIAPGDTEQAMCRVAVPMAEGDASLTITLVQDGVRWFDEVHVDNGASARTVIRRG